MAEFWEEAFKDKQEMWGSAASVTALAAAEIFAGEGFKKVLIPGIGYGRNAQPFIAEGMEVTGIEISATAIDLAQKHFGKNLKIYHGSVTDMPFDDQLYDGIFCHAVIHLLDEEERKKLIAGSYAQLKKGGLMIFTAITKDAQTYGKGTPIGKDRFEQFGGVNMFFYDEQTIRQEFEHYGLAEVNTMTENFPYHFIKCQK